MAATGAAFNLLDLLQIADRAFPTGAFVHSHGLEVVLKQHLGRLEDVLAMRLEQQLGRFELVFLLAATRGDGVALDEQYHAMVLPREAREASSQVGRQLLRNAADLFGVAALTTAATALPYAHVPIVWGMVCAALGVPPRVAGATYAFQTLRGQISAAQRLSRFGQVEAQRLLHRLKPAVDAAVEQALTMELADAASFTPLLDIASMAHERTEVRLFVS